MAAIRNLKSLKLLERCLYHKNLSLCRKLKQDNYCIAHAAQFQDIRNEHFHVMKSNQNRLKLNMLNLLKSYFTSKLLTKHLMVGTVSVHRAFCTSCSSSRDDSQYADGSFNNVYKMPFSVPKAEFDWEYLLDPNNRDAIRQNIQNRKGIGSIDGLQDLWKQVENRYSLTPTSFFQCKDEEVLPIQAELRSLAADIPNSTHPAAPIGGENMNKVVETCGTKREFTIQPKGVVDIGQQMGMLRMEHTGHTTGHRSYYFLEDFARLEQALIRYTTNTLLEKGFHLLSVPDLVHPAVIEGCGFKTTGERTQVYHLEPQLHGDVCLAGTGEMPTAGYFMNSQWTHDQLPKRVATVSRCYRAETSTAEQGIYRVHQFTKVEMFMLTGSAEQSDERMAELLHIQKQLFSNLGLHFRVLDMASEELGAPAYRKYDMEAWMPAQQIWGEISSTSNCIDYQSRRLNITYSDNTIGDGTVKHVHTLNGTACALPRTIMAIVENYQQEDGSVEVPAVLQKYMGGKTHITPSASMPNMKWIKFTKNYKKKSRKS